MCIHVCVSPFCGCRAGVPASYQRGSGEIPKHQRTNEFGTSVCRSFPCVAVGGGGKFFSGRGGHRRTRTLWVPKPQRILLTVAIPPRKGQADLIRTRRIGFKTAEVVLLGMKRCQMPQGRRPQYFGCFRQVRHDLNREPISPFPVPRNFKKHEKAFPPLPNACSFRRLFFLPFFLSLLCSGKDSVSFYFFVLFYYNSGETGTFLSLPIGTSFSLFDSKTTGIR